MYKLFIFLVLSLVISCNTKHDEINNEPIIFKDNVIISSEKQWFYEVDQPTQGKMKVYIKNYSQKDKKFIIEIREIK